MKKSLLHTSPRHKGAGARTVLTTSFVVTFSAAASIACKKERVELPEPEEKSDSSSIYRRESDGLCFRQENVLVQTVYPATRLRRSRSTALRTCVTRARILRTSRGGLPERRAGSASHRSSGS